jgi:DNA-binding NarL/FixJ family response regulator
LFPVAARILIADDNVPVRRALRRVLEETRICQVFEAGNGKEAVDTAIQISPDLIILDLAMPEMDGFACTREISKLLPGVPILLHTLYWSPRVAIEALKAGARKAILKSQSKAVIAAVMELLPPERPRLIAVLNPFALNPSAAKDEVASEPSAQYTPAANTAQAEDRLVNDVEHAQGDDQDQKKRKAG